MRGSALTASATRARLACDFIRLFYTNIDLPYVFRQYPSTKGNVLGRETWNLPSWINLVSKNKVWVFLSVKNQHIFVVKTYDNGIFFNTLLKSKTNGQFHKFKHSGILNPLQNYISFLYLDISRKNRIFTWKKICHLIINGVIFNVLKRL